MQFYCETIKIAYRECVSDLDYMERKKKRLDRMHHRRKGSRHE